MIKEIISVLKLVTVTQIVNALRKVEEAISWEVSERVKSSSSKSFIVYNRYREEVEHE